MIEWAAVRESFDTVGLAAEFDELCRKRDRRMLPEVVRHLCDEGLSYPEVAERTGYSLRQVKNLASQIAGTVARGPYRNLNGNSRD